MTTRGAGSAADAAATTAPAPVNPVAAFAVTVVVLAKAPIPGQVKTRLTPAYSPAEASILAGAALHDTFTAVCAMPHVRPVCVLAGSPGGCVPAAIPVLEQAAGTLGARIAAALEDAYTLLGGPVLLVGMDTPQLTAGMLTQAAAALASHDCVLGPAADGGWWLLGVHRPLAAALTDVPPSRADTGRRQRAALVAAGLTVATLPVLRDVDTPGDAQAVAALAPHTRFAQTLVAMGRGRAA